MPDPTQKQIAAKYKDDLTYYKKTHSFRRWRFWLTMLALIGGVVWAVGFHRLGGSAQFFNTGPISENHARFANDCAACHSGASTDMLSILPVDKTKAALQSSTPLLETLKGAGNRALASAKENLSDPQKLATAAHAALNSLNLDHIDRACLQCHDGLSLHQPGTKAVKFRESQKELSIVAAGACSSCHREHVGTARMKLPTDETCVSCHASEQRLAESLKLAKYDGMWAAAHSQNARLGGDVQWLPPAQVNQKPKVVRAFSDGHPAFLFEGQGAKDNANLKFNHARHFADDITSLNAGNKLDCRQCHVLDADGVGMQRITYDQHCQKCHSLGADPDLPGFNIPHHDPQKVRDFLASLYTQWTDYAGKRFAITDAVTLKAFLDQRGEKFRQHWPSNLEEVQRRVFFEGDPPIAKAPKGQFLPACAKCHTVTDAKPVPAIAKTNLPDGWLTRGPYKHAAHLHMDCRDCHGGAETSKETTDILLPNQKLCAECHRPRDYAHVETNPTERIAPTFGEYSPEAARKQRKEGGVFDSCLGCHKYHVPAAELEIARSLAK